MNQALTHRPKAVVHCLVAYSLCRSVRSTKSGLESKRRVVSSRRMQRLSQRIATASGRNQAGSASGASDGLPLDFRRGGPRTGSMSWDVKAPLCIGHGAPPFLKEENKVSIAFLSPYVLGPEAGCYLAMCIGAGALEPDATSLCATKSLALSIA